MSAPEIHLQKPTPTPRKRPAPSFNELSFTYEPAKDRDVNLLILFHGLGDTRAPFAQLGTSLNLAQTATLSLQAPQRVPLLEEEAWQWWPSFDELGELIRNPNPTPTLTLLLRLLSHLTTISPLTPSWSPSQIHLFGFAQGGSCASELALAFTRTTKLDLASVVTVSGPLLSFPTVERKSRAKVLVVYRKGEERVVGVGSFRKGFESVQEVGLPRGDGMPRGRQEWEEIMRFWAATLDRKSALELDDDVYEVRGGVDAAKAAGATAPTA